MVKASMMSSRYRHIIWDWNGTLLDDVDHSLATTNGLLQEYALPPLDLQRYREVFDFPVQDYYRRIGFDLDRQSFHALASSWLDRYMSGSLQLQLRLDARQTLAAVAARGLTQSLLSALEQERLTDQVQHYALAEHFIACVGVEDHLGAGKVERGKRWMADVEVDPERVLLIGDTTHDLAVAAALGVDCVLVLGGHHSAERLGASGKAPVMESLNAVLACL